MKKIAVLGSTGSVGRNALRVLSQLKGCEVIALSAGSNIDLLEKQIALFSSKEVAVFDETAALLLAKRCPQVKVLAGREGVSQLAASKEVDFVLMAIAGTAALLPTIAAIEAKKEIGLASKEVLVSAGDLIMRMAAENGVRLLPVDSEHSAIFQCLQGENAGAVRRLILTARAVLSGVIPTGSSRR